MVLQDAGRLRLVALDPTAQDVAWETTLPAERLGGAAVLSGDRIWVPLVDGSVVAFDGVSGALVVRSTAFGVDLSDGSLAQVPVLSDGVVMVSAGLALLGIDEVAG